ncbi:MAG: hypothetical protein NZ853_03070 [Leptospiraceae bacterium]|nr:hypothetical protein [Leptospiraceae bacterium]MDW7975156.1 hypothetical protein [Leptospiraceae bacterium]
MSGNHDQKEVYYRIQLTVAVYKDKKLAYKKEVIVPTWYTRRSEAREHIRKEIERRLKETDFFISPRVDYDLVRYTQEGSVNTYIRYRIIEEEGDILKLQEQISIDKSIS